MLSSFIKHKNFAPDLSGQCQILTTAKIVTSAKFWAHVNSHQIWEPRQILEQRQKCVNPLQNVINRREPREPRNYLAYDNNEPTSPRAHAIHWI